MNITITLLGQMITFALLVYFTMKKVWPPLMQAMEERQKKIAEGLAAAERGKHEHVLAEQRAKELLRDAKAQAADIVSHAQRRANEIVEEAKDTARGEGERLLSAAQAEIEREQHRVREELRAQVGRLALAAAEKILRKEVDADIHRQTLDTFAKQI